MEKHSDGRTSIPRSSIKQTLHSLRSKPESTLEESSTLNTTANSSTVTGATEESAQGKASRKRSRLNVSTCTPGLACMRRSNVQSPCGPQRIQGALGLTPVMRMLNMQGDISTKAPDVITSLPLEEKMTRQTPRLPKPRRKILSMLNSEAECSLQSETSILHPPTAALSKQVKPRPKMGIASTLTRQASKVFRNITARKPAEATSLNSYTEENVASEDLTFTETANTAMIDLSLDTSIINSSRMDVVDIDTSIASTCSVETILAGNTRRKLRPRRSSCSRPASQNHGRISTMSLGLTKALSDAESFQALVAKLAEKKSDKTISSDSLPVDTDDLDSSYSKALMNSCLVSSGDEDMENKSQMNVTSFRKSKCPAKDENGNVNRRVGSTVKSLHKTARAKESETLTPSSSGRGLHRSRSLRIWGRHDGVEVTGNAGHTPLPNRRRRHPSYEERLIM